MRMQFRTPRTKNEQSRLEKMQEIALEIPVTILNGGVEISAQAESLLHNYRFFPLILPSDSEVIVHDFSICEYRHGSFESFRKPKRSFDGLLIYTRPPSRSGSKNLSYEFPISIKTS